MSVDTTACDACGELKPTEGGRAGTDYAGWPYDEPVEWWICAACVRIADRQRTDNEEDKVEQYHHTK